MRWVLTLSCALAALIALYWLVGLAQDHRRRRRSGSTEPGYKADRAGSVHELDKSRCHLPPRHGGDDGAARSIAVAIGGTAFVGIWLLRDVPSHSHLDPFEFSANWNLTAIPMFLLMGAIAARGGLTTSLFAVARLWLAGLPGGLAVATNIACAMFAAASGSSLATAAAMARIAVPEMLKLGYHPGLATGVVAAAGTLGALIPPSILFVIFGWYTETPIGKLLIAGILPGLLNAALFTAYILGYCKIFPDGAPKTVSDASWRERISALREVWPIPVLVLSVIGGIYRDWAATEAAALGALSALILVLIRSKMT